MIEGSLENKIEGELINFARKEPRINAVFRGTNPESSSEDSRTYYCLVGRDYSFDDEFEDRVTELDLRIAQVLPQKSESIEIICWPIESGDVGEYGFIKEGIYRTLSF